MGTHPIFESDFDCLTEESLKMTSDENYENGDSDYDHKVKKKKSKKEKRSKKEKEKRENSDDDYKEEPDIKEEYDSPEHEPDSGSDWEDEKPAKNSRKSSPKKKVTVK